LVIETQPPEQDFDFTVFHEDTSEGNRERNKNGNQAARDCGQAGWRYKAVLAGVGFDRGFDCDYRLCPSSILTFNF
jgi:hypothetical protein